MPLLKREPEIFPHGLFELPEAGFPWSVAHTRSRQEKALLRHLSPLRIPFYLPQAVKRIRRNPSTWLTSWSNCANSGFRGEPGTVTSRPYALTF